MRPTAVSRVAARVIAIAFPTAGLSSCSTYEAYDQYSLQESGKSLVTFQAQEAQIAIEFIPDQKLASMGLFGVPAIPIFARTKPETAVVLDVELTLRKHSGFYFTVPCLITPTEELCPQYVRITAIFGSAEYALNYEGTGLEYSLPLSRDTKRIEGDAILDHYGYLGDWTADVGLIRLSYAFACSARCPTEFSLPVDDIAVARDVLRSTGSYNFQKRRLKDYRAVRPLQDEG